MSRWDRSNSYGHCLTFSNWISESLVIIWIWSTLIKQISTRIPIFSTCFLTPSVFVGEVISFNGQWNIWLMKQTLSWVLMWNVQIKAFLNNTTLLWSMTRLFQAEAGISGSTIILNLYACSFLMYFCGLSGYLHNPTIDISSPSSVISRSSWGGLFAEFQNCADKVMTISCHFLMFWVIIISRNLLA
jgi:hypothetical protein